MQSRAASAVYRPYSKHDLITGRHFAWPIAPVNGRQLSHRPAAQPQPRDVTTAQTLRCSQPTVCRRYTACAPSSRTVDPDADQAEQSHIRCSPAFGLVPVTMAAAALWTCGGAADAAGLLIREEPANALSLPTWAIHVSSVIEWIAAMGLVWRYAEVTGDSHSLLRKCASAQPKLAAQGPILYQPS